MANEVKSESIPTSVFNLELTIFENASKDLMRDAGISSEAEMSRTRPSDLRKKFVSWCIDKTLEDLGPVLDRTYSEAGDRISKWAGLIIAKEHENGRKIGLYSATFPEEIVNAYADGIENAFGVDVDMVNGATLLTDEDGRYTGVSRGIYKGRTLDAGIKEDNRSYVIVADSFRSAFPEIMRGSHPLLVNPESMARDDIRFQLVDMIRVPYGEPNSVLLRKAGDTSTNHYDLRSDFEADNFLDDFYAPSE